MKRQLKIWKKNFEYDNFGIDKVIDKINEHIREINQSVNTNIDEIDKKKIKQSRLLLYILNILQNLFSRNQENWNKYKIFDLLIDECSNCLSIIRWLVSFKKLK
jgi:hypothetical protein